MARHDNCTVMQCDRCQETKYFQQPDDEGLLEWYTVRRVDADGQATGTLLCKDCWAAYQTFAKAQDAAFATFMARKDADGKEATA